MASKAKPLATPARAGVGPVGAAASKAAPKVVPKAGLGNRRKSVPESTVSNKSTPIKSPDLKKSKTTVEPDVVEPGPPVINLETAFNSASDDHTMPDATVESTLRDASQAEPCQHHSKARSLVYIL